MKRNINFICALLLTLLTVFTFHSVSQAVDSKTTDSKEGVVLNVDGAISPAIADYLIRGINKANDMSASVIIIKMDTPGGLDKSMRDIIKAIIASKIPVVSYVAPSGARAASAGTYIMYASHIAAMAPATNLGSATPVSIGGGFPSPEKEKPAKDEKESEKKSEKKPATDDESTMKAKVLNDAVAYIEGLAKLHDRNVEWAVKAVKEAANISSEAALKSGVIDLIAKDMDDLLKQIQGREVKLGGRVDKIDVAGVVLENIQPDWRTRFLTVITDPSVAYVLLMLGVYGIFFEFANPGFIVPGVVGAICILLAMYALQLLPINFAGLALMILGIIFMIIEAVMPSFGALGVGGVIAFVAGSILLLDTSIPGLGISWAVIGLVATLNALFFFGLITMAFKSRRRQIVSGREAMLGAQGVVLENIASGEVGQVRVHSEIWQARGGEELCVGDRIKVVSLEGLTLEVKKSRGDKNG